MSIRRRLALMICPELRPETCDATPVFRSVRGSGDAAPELPSSDYLRGFDDGWDCLRGIWDQVNDAQFTRRDRFDEEAVRLGLTPKQFGPLWGRVLGREAVSDVLPGIDVVYYMTGQRLPEYADQVRGAEG
jgi:hypothetical protein